MIPSISFVKLNNMKMRLFLPLSAFAALSVCLMLSSCAGGGRAVTDDPAAESRRFPLVEVPGVIVDREEAAEYLGLHYWDSFTDTAEVHACDSMRVNGVTRSEVEQKFADVPLPSMRLERCREYGLVYYYRTGEKDRNKEEQ